MKYEAYIGEALGNVASPSVGLQVSGIGIFKAVIIVNAINDWMKLRLYASNGGGSITFYAKNTQGPQKYEFYIDHNAAASYNINCDLDSYGNQLDTINSGYTLQLFGPRLRLDF